MALEMSLFGCLKYENDIYNSNTDYSVKFKAFSINTLSIINKNLWIHLLLNVFKAHSESKWSFSGFNVPPIHK